MSLDHFLYVEDEPTNQLVMKLLMEKVLYTKNYTIFDHSADFMKRLKGLPIRPSIIMLDIHIAPINGFELLDLIREDPVYLDTKIIALTASVMIEEVEKMRNSGFDGAIGKPIDLSTFPSVIKRILDGEMVWQI
jgi:CheY-like chemotaxis protein